MINSNKLFSLSICLLYPFFWTCSVVFVDSLKPNLSPPGYYAFEKASKFDGAPPRVRKPPYVPADVPCPGAVKSSFHFSPRDTLCGDLNRGYVPVNPMNQEIGGQPYPFEIIKNKTLYFLAQSLPFLKADINNIPKVAKLQPAASSGVHSTAIASGAPSIPAPAASQIYNQYHHAHYPGPVAIHQHSHPHSMHHTMPVLRKKRSTEDAGNQAVREASGKKAPANNYRANFFQNLFNLSETRQKACEQKDGILCQLMQVLSSVSSGGSLFNSLNQAAQMITAAHSAANTAQNLGSIASMLHQYSSGTSTLPTTLASSPIMSGEQNQKSMIAQLIALLSALNGGQSGNTGGTGTGFNPLTAIVDYFSGGSALSSSQLPARRKKPLDLEDMASETVVEQIPPTPCPSLEEYVAPVFARNYQGIWKYVVQIPNEGYFTQTVQKTACVKSRCDFMEGVCHEAPRWVSLLVAEIYYPQTPFPNMIASASVNKPQAAPFVGNPGTGIPKHQHPHIQNLNFLNELPISDELFEQFLNNYRSGDSPAAASPVPGNNGVNGNNNAHIRRTANPGPQVLGVQQEATGRNPRSIPEEKEKEARKSGGGGGGVTSTGANQSGSSGGEEEKCDGHDKIGCYVIRVYYDWFLVPGSCKCWKKSSSNGSSGLETIKKIFIGK